MEKTDGLYDAIYNIERKTCASAECEVTCPAYKENEEYLCGARIRTKEIASAIRTYISGCLPQEKEVEYLPDGITPDYDISQSEEGFNACLKSVREALGL